MHGRRSRTNGMPGAGLPAGGGHVTPGLRRILIVDDHELVRTGLRGVLSAAEGFDVVAEASDGIQALAAVELHHPDVVVMDLQMPGMGGIEATRRILKLRPDTRVLVVTMFDDDVRRR